MDKIVIYVHGGIVKDVRANIKRELKVEIFDADNLEEERTGREIDKEWDKICKATKSIM